ncbi:SIS domain-containing protein [Gracilimonas mengyeensis]|uniref:Galactosamine 6-phosphate isomerase AgaS n=1 Tax=Gracilimonas mengyeensis TaxID=1302730 RepID=A0A521BTK5_9BACT|nr:SIS domain-containing protein [Gracilimonas mengyeensis]SMO50483.1 galactosamine 6-phosphate isomerase AgaS [Gracilimonas mengyeensis]
MQLTSNKNSSCDDTFTCKEILGQPELWQKTYTQLLKKSSEIKDFFDAQNIHPGNEINIILTGAGTSAYIGEITRYAFLKAGFHRTQAIPTTDLVTHYEDLLDTETPLLLISFGRSGNSPESVAALNLANEHCKKVSHLIITCNPSGKLSQKADPSNSCIFTLPPEAEDKGLAMTGSFSSMVLATTLIADLPNIQEHQASVDTLVALGNEVIDNYKDELQYIANKDFTRVIFLGDGPNLGCARESHLKVQELSDGICIGKFDSFLGFRHGPKAVVDEHSLIVYLLSNNEHVSRYQFDLIEQIADQKLGLHHIAIGNKIRDKKLVDTFIHLPESSSCPEHFLPIPYVLVAQMLGFYKSEALALDPDNPSKNGAISRVVKGVTIYE